jgi:hypothetical protein
MERTVCPTCSAVDVVDLADLLYSATVDYFRCRSCGCWWTVPKGVDQPATRIVLRNPDATLTEKAG